jgi:prepilin-type N-terminal cleavage/methylation domain-containing protein
VRAPPGFSLVELIVALTLLAVVMIALAGSALVAQRSFVEAGATERAVSAAAAVLDSLLRVPAPESAARRIDGIVLEWDVATAGDALVLDLRVLDEPAGVNLTFQSLRPLAGTDRAAQ